MLDYLPNLTLINAIITNLAIIIASILSYYFITLYITTNSKRTHLSFVTADFLSNATLGTKLLLGLLLGFISFILSLNDIPLLDTASSVDMRYVFIFFSVIYGSEQIGKISTTTLVVLKAVSYYFADGPNIFTDYFNNIVLSFILLFLAIILKRQNFSVMKKNILFICIFLLIRYFLFIFYFASFFHLTEQLTFLAYAFIFSGLFLTATFVIELAISISSSVHVYRTAAIYDSLTNLYNKESFNFFLDYVANLTEAETNCLSIAVIDIDNFKNVNDKFGHPTGDYALRYLSEQLRALKKEGKHYICRIGGDEFAIIHNEEPAAAEQYYESLMKRLALKQFNVKGKNYQLTLSVGLAHFMISPDFNPQQALAEADHALYQAKEQGKNQIVTIKGTHNQKEPLA